MSLYKKSKELREKRASIHQKMLDMQKKAKTEARGLNAEEQSSWDKADKDLNELTSQVQAVEAQIQSHEDRSARLEELGLSDDDRANQRGDGNPGRSDNPGTGGNDGLDTPEARATAGRQALRSWLRSGGQALNEQQRTALRYGQQISEQIPSGGDAINLAAMANQDEARALAAGTGSDGGFTVAQAFGGSLNEAMLAYGGMRQLATVITTGTGASMPFPTVNDTTNVGEIITENLQHNAGDMSFGAVTLDAMLYSSKIVRVSQQLLQDSFFNVESLVGRLLGTRIGRITNTHFTVGDGSSKPKGVMAAAAVGKVAAAAAALTINEMLDLKHSVDPAYRAMAKWMFNDSTLKVLKQMTYGGTADARPLWKPGIAQGEPDTIDGDPYQINQDVASIGASAKSVAYGDFSHYIIRDCRDVTVLRLTERYADYLQVGFLAFSRHDGDLVNTAAVKTLAQASA